MLQIRPSKFKNLKIMVIKFMSYYLKSMKNFLKIENG